jgi:inward rectifier potassium channel
MALGKNTLNEELGLGTKAEQETRSRLMNRDGYFNVQKTGLTFWNALDIYNSLMLMGWGRFYTIVVCSFLGINILFALGFTLLGRTSINGSQATNWIAYLADAFFLCVQTFATIGYGVLSPNGFLANTLAVMVAFCGIIMGALATGLLFARFSRPMAKIMFSNDAIISPYKEGQALMFRVANTRLSQLIDVNARIILAKMEGEGLGRIRRFYQLNVEISKIMFMPQHWTVVHAINEESPFWNMTPEQFEVDECEVIVLIMAIDDSFSQTVHTRYSYYAKEVVWGAKFANMFTDSSDYKVTVDLRRLHSWEKVETVENKNVE